MSEERFEAMVAVLHAHPMFTLNERLVCECGEEIDQVAFDAPSRHKAAALIAAGLVGLDTKGET